LRVCVDTTILLDILKDEFRSFQDKLYAALSRKEKLRRLRKGQRLFLMASD